MALTLTDLQNKLKNIDEVSLMEVLEITSEDLVNRFVDRIDQKYDDLVTEFDADNIDDSDEGHSDDWDFGYEEDSLFQELVEEAEWLEDSTNDR
jgi:hypothetical protein